MPSLKPNRLRGVACARRGRRRAAEPELRPAHRDDAEADPDQVAHGVHRDLRVVGAGLDARGRRPSSAGSSWSPRNAGRSRSAGGPLRRRGRTGRRRSDGPNADRERERRTRAGRAPRRCPRRRRPGCRRPRRPGAASAPAVIRSAARGPALQQVDAAAARSVVVRSSAAKCSRSWAGVMIPAWCCPRNGTTPVRRARAGCEPLTAKPAATPTPATAAPTPAAPSSRRRDTRRGAGSSGSATGRSVTVTMPTRSRRHDARDLADRLGQRVDRLGQLLDVGVGQLGVELVAVAGLVGGEQVVDAP